MMMNFSLQKLILLTSINLLTVSCYAMDNEPNILGGRVIGERQLDRNDNDNAMEWGTAKEQKTKCFTAIYNLIPNMTESEINTAFADALLFINSPDSKNVLRTVPPVTLNGPRFHAYRYQYKNALHTMIGLQNRHYTPYAYQNTTSYNPIQMNDPFSKCPTRNGEKEVRMKELLARIWTLINRHHNPQEISLMKTNFLANLNYCVEDDGHLTCNIGKTGRLIQSIEGYIEGVTLTLHLPEPDVFCGHYMREFTTGLTANDPMYAIVVILAGVDENFSATDFQNRILTEKTKALTRINGLYGQNSPRVNQCMTKMNEFFEEWRKTYNDECRAADRPLAVAQDFNPPPINVPVFSTPSNRPQPGGNTTEDQLRQVYDQMELMDAGVSFDEFQVARLEALRQEAIIREAAPEIERNKNTLGIKYNCLGNIEYNPITKQYWQIRNGTRLHRVYL